MKSTIVVTGASGFIAQQLILDLLEAGHHVRGTVRSQAKGILVKQTLEKHSQFADNFECFEADLEKDEGWTEAFQSASIIHHVASPVPTQAPEHPDDIIRPAKEGTLRVLQAASRADVKRVVLTSSIAAVVYGSSPHSTFTEDDWTDPSSLKECPPYPASKTLAEQAAWDYVRNVDESIKLTVVNPAVVFGPVLSKNVKTSISIISLIFDGHLPAIPNIGFHITNVKDVSKVHIHVMENEHTYDQRYIVADKYYTLKEIADILRTNFPDNAKKIPKLTMPDFFIHFFSLFSKDMKLLSYELSKKRNVSSQKVTQLLGENLISAEESILASAKSLIDQQKN